LIGCIIQARVNSKRLPKKILKCLDEKNNALEYVISQLKSSRKIDKIVIATTSSNEDDIIVDFAKENNYHYFRGSEKDVLDRYFQCAKSFNFNTIVRITSDCPLIDPHIVDKVIEKFESTNYDYVTNTFPPTFPKGLDVEIFKFSILEHIWKNAILPSEREHVTQYLFNNKEFKIGNLKNEHNLSKLRWTLDQEEDFEFLCQIIRRVKKRPILMNDVLTVLSCEPQLSKINSHIDPDEGLKKSKKEDEEFKKEQRFKK
jgi:spore coat polysaccharide biosynthesis protein SpsF